MLIKNTDQVFILETIKRWVVTPLTARYLKKKKKLNLANKKAKYNRKTFRLTII